MAKPKKPLTKLIDQIRQAMDHCGVTRYRISQETGIDESALAKFHSGKRGLSLENLDLLCEYLGIHIVVENKPSKKGK